MSDDTGWVLDAIQTEAERRARSQMQHQIQTGQVTMSGMNLEQVVALVNDFYSATGAHPAHLTPEEIAEEGAAARKPKN